MLIVRFVVILGLILTVNVVAGGAVRPVAAVAVAGEAYALAAGAPPVVMGGSPSVTLPASGGTITDATPGVGVGVGGGAGLADSLAASVTGSPDDGTVSSTAAVNLVELFGGVVRAIDLRVTATASVNGRASSEASMSTTSVTVGGLNYTDVRPNTRVDLPGLGYVILNEQYVGGGEGAASAVINAIHLWVTVPSALGVPAGTEIIVGHAAAGVPDIDATRAVASGPVSTATPVPWPSLSPLAPIDISISDRDLGNDNLFDIDFDNANDNGGSVATGTGGADGAGGPARPSPAAVGGTVVVTVVVVVVTPTSTPTPPSTVTPTPGAR